MMSDITKGVGKPSTGESEPEPQPVGDAVGGIFGTAAGAGVGALAGPLGILVGAAAGALGGWWAGHVASDVLESFNDDAQRRRHERGSGGGSYDRVRDYYRFGHLAGANPDYQGRSFEEIESDLERTWQQSSPPQGVEWEEARDYVADGYRHHPRR
jgi:hypothetical protein